jgi:hypothetical protein
MGLRKFAWHSRESFEAKVLLVAHPAHAAGAISGTRVPVFRRKCDQRKKRERVSDSIQPERALAQSTLVVSAEISLAGLCGMVGRRRFRCKAIDHSASLASGANPCHFAKRGGTPKKQITNACIAEIAGNSTLISGIDNLVFSMI